MICDICLNSTNSILFDSSFRAVSSGGFPAARASSKKWSPGAVTVHGTLPSTKELSCGADANQSRKDLSTIILTNIFCT